MKEITQLIADELFHSHKRIMENPISFLDSIKKTCHEDYIGVSTQVSQRWTKIERETQGERQTGSNKIDKIAINWLVDHTAKNKHPS